MALSLLLVLFFAHLVYTSAIAQTSTAPASPADSIPHPRNIIYAQTLLTNTSAPNSLLPLVEHETHVTHIILATLALSKTSTTNITLNGIPPFNPVYDTLWSEVATLQVADVKIMLMLGGAGSVAFTLLQQNFEGYYPPLLQVLRDTGVDGIDLDIELPFPSSVSLSTVLQLLNSLATDMGDDLIITMAPVATDFTTGRGASGPAWNYRSLDAAAVSSTKANGKLVDWYNVQFYGGYGDAGSTEVYDQIIAKGWLPERIGMGLVAFGISGWYEVGVYESVIAELRERYDNFGGVDGWEYGLAGGDDGVEPWEWVGRMGQAMFGGG